MIEMLLWMVWCLAAVWLLAKLDKKVTIKKGGDIEKSDRWDSLIDYYNGRVTIYKVLFVLSLVPIVNVGLAVIINLVTVVLIGILFSYSSFWQKGFWSKIF
jgi:hypothetical protein